MIIKGKSRAAPSSLAGYLLQKRENESVDFKGAFGTVPQELQPALEEMGIIASASNCKNYLYHASINPPEGEHLTPEQWERAVDILAQKLDLEGHQRAVVEHVKEGRAHYHVVFNRVNPETLKAVRMSHSYRKHEEAAREIEKEFGLSRLESSHERGHDPEGGGKPYEQKDFDQARRTKIDPRTVAADLAAAWQESDNGAAFIKEAEKRGYVIAKGDKRDFVAIDAGGGVHSLARRTKNKAADVRARFEDVPAGSLPSVDEAREQQQAHAAEAQAEKEKQPAAASPNEKSGAIGKEREQTPEEKQQAARSAARKAFNDEKKAEIEKALKVGGPALDFVITLQESGLQVAKNKWGRFSAVAENGFVFPIRADKELLSKFEEHEKSGLIIPTVENVREELKEEKEKKQAAHKAGVFYEKGDMVSQQADATRHFKDKTKAMRSAARDISLSLTKDEVLKPAPQPQQSQPEPRGPRYSQWASLIRDVAPKAAERYARTEQTDAKRQVSAKDAMREIFETDYSKNRTTGGNELGREQEGRERERER